ncbi:MAG: flavodoxin family protein [Verrucomicrobia bacterium]|nr:flavodoxin family protein [Verrucomicrobiota bacterium]
MKVVAFNGSPHADGNTFRLIKAVLGELEEAGIDTEVVQIGGKAVHGCTACYRCRKEPNGRCVIENDMLNDCIAKMRDADGIILGSPTYFADITPEIKALIDRAGFVSRSNGHFLRRKVGASVVAVRRAGGIHAFNSLNHFFLIGEMIVPGSSYWNLGYGGKAGEVEEDAEGLRTMTALGQNMAWLLQKTNAE